MTIHLVYGNAKSVVAYIRLRDMTIQMIPEISTKYAVNIMPIAKGIGRDTNGSLLNVFHMQSTGKMGDMGL